MKDRPHDLDHIDVFLRMVSFGKVKECDVMEAGDAMDMTRFTLAEIALNFPSSIGNLIRHDLDFCCSGKTSFVEACEAIHLNPIQIWSEINEEASRIGRYSSIHFGT